jgi:hypothetical protein
MKKKKKHKKARGESVPGHRLLEEFEAHRRQMFADYSRSFDNGVAGISKLLGGYSAIDIATSVFVSGLWLPNLASLVKHQYILAIFLSKDPASFAATDRISTYADFSHFLESVKAYLPTFFRLEDYVPESEWGEVKFHHFGKSYRIFYGSDLETPYDFLTHFQMMFCSLENEFFGAIGRSPSEELRLTLKFQDDIIARITRQPVNRDLSEIRPGHLEIPSEEFWNDARSFLSQYSSPEELEPVFVERYSVELRSMKKEMLIATEFEKAIDLGLFIPAFFVKINGRFLPLLPRRVSGILLDTWFSEYLRNEEKVISTSGTPITLRIGTELHKYLKDRLRTSALFSHVSALTETNQVDDVMFPSAFVSQDRLILFLVLPPSSGGDILTYVRARAKKFKKAYRLLCREPLRLALLGEQRSVEFRHGPSGKGRLIPTIFYVLPRTSLGMGYFVIPKNLPGHFILLEQLVGMIDELRDVGQFAEFLNFIGSLDSKLSSPMNSWLDKFGAFKRSHGVLIDGATEPDAIYLDPHWGSNMRYETLAEFWKSFPEVGFWGHPRSWNVIQESPTTIRFDARGFLGCAMYCRIGTAHIYINSLFERMSFEQGKIANFIIECAQDSLTKQASLIESHIFFKTSDFLQVFVVPQSVVEAESNLSYLRHLQPRENLWVSDRAFPQPGRLGIRIVYNDKKVLDAFMNAQDSSHEIELLIELMRQINSYMPDTSFAEVVALLEAQKAQRPRFQLYAVSDRVSFPEIAGYAEPGITDYKLARKRISEIAKKLGLGEGQYHLEDAKLNLNALRKALVQEINREVSKYDFKQSIPLIISNADALSNENERDETMVRYSLEHDVEYSRQEKLAADHADFIALHRCYTYLIEKFVQLTPGGESIPNDRDLGYLLAITDFLLRIYQASDAIHYEYSPVGLKIDHDFKLEVQHAEGQDSKEQTFAIEEAETKLGLRGDQSDRVESLRLVPNFLDELDEAFELDLGFTLRNLVSVLQVLSMWTYFKKGAPLQTVYHASTDEIVEVVLQSVESLTNVRVTACLDFLTLKRRDVTRILGRAEPTEDLPVWEHRKRYARYRIRPLIIIDSIYFWGPYSARMAGRLWANAREVLPTDLKGQHIENAIANERVVVSQALAEKSCEIIRRFTSHVEKNVKLHKRDPAGNHPERLGDYDNLAFLADKNIIINVECKDIQPVFSMKDMKSLREKIFGRVGIDDGHFAQINPRREYLEKNLERIGAALRWPVYKGSPPRIITIYLTRRVYWWTRFPPESIKAVFLKVDMLSEFIKSLQ